MVEDRGEHQKSRSDQRPTPPTPSNAPRVKSRLRESEMHSLLNEHVGTDDEPEMQKYSNA